MAGPDIFRAVMISLAALLIGTVAFGAYTAWRDRYMPAPRRLPLPGVFVFVLGYVMLLVQQVVDRFANLGQDIGAPAVLSMAALLLNAVAMVMLVGSMQPPRRREGRRDADDR